MTTCVQIPLVKETNPTIDDKAVALSKALKEGRVEQEVEEFLQAFLVEGSRMVEKYNGLKGSAGVELVGWKVEGEAICAEVRSTLERTTSVIEFSFDFEEDEIQVEVVREHHPRLISAPIGICSVMAGNVVHSFLEIHAASRF